MNEKGEKEEKESKDLCEDEKAMEEIAEEEGKENEREKKNCVRMKTRGEMYEKGEKEEEGNKNVCREADKWKEPPLSARPRSI